LNARYLVDGTAQVLNQQIELTVHLTDGDDQTLLWSAKFTRPLSQLPQVQSEIAESVAREVQIKIIPERSGNPKDSSDPLAHEAYLHGRFELEQKNVPAFWRALEQFSAAVELDPHYAGAYAGIAETYINLASNIPSGPAYAHAKAAALNAIRLNNNLAEAHRDLGWLLFSDDADLPGAENEYLRALQINPSDARAHHWYAQLLIAERRTDAALREARTGLDLDPLSLGSNYNYGFILIHAGRPEEAKRHLGNLLLREPRSEVVYGYLGRAFAALGQYDRSAECFKQAMELSELKYQYEANWAYALAKAGDIVRAQRLVHELEKKANSGVWVPASTMTEAYIGLGNTDRAFLWLRRCVAEHSCTLLEVNNEPFYRGLGSDPRFAQITGSLYGHGITTQQAAIVSR
jgi:tetratricopeptide (TPR) repeat protein